jgi:hypothetical protein
LIIINMTHLNGCAVGSRSFSIDSNSRVPFFGLELKERKPKSTAPAYQSIGRSTDDGNLKIAFPVLPGTSRSPSAKWNSKAGTSTTISGISSGTRPEKFMRQASSNVPDEPIPLPRTDESRSKGSPSTASRGIDFQ